MRGKRDVLMAGSIAFAIFAATAVRAQETPAKSGAGLRPHPTKPV